MFSTMLFQRGGSYYVDDFSGVNFNTNEAIDAFRQWTEFNTKYSMPLAYDPLNRFRAGEYPIIVTNYTFYNNLAVGAPEIKGLWEMTAIPGIMQEDGTNKVQSEHYLVLSPSCTDAEKRIIDELAPSCTGSMKVTDIKTRKFREVLSSEDDSDEK